MGKNLDVLSKLSKDNNQTLKLAPLSNIKSARKWKDGLGIVEIVVDEKTITNLLLNNLVGGFIVADREEFLRVKKELG